MSINRDATPEQWRAFDRYLEQSKADQLQEQLAALTTENANLASLVGEMREALGNLLRGIDCKGVKCPDLPCSECPIMDKSLMDLCNESEKYLARTPEQAGERQRVLEGLAKAVAEERTAGKRLRELEFQYGRKWLESQQVADILNEAENKHNAAIQAVSDALEVKRG